MNKYFVLVLIFISTICCGTYAQIDANLYDLLWEDLDVAMERLEQDSFRVFEEIRNEESYDVMMKLNDLSVKLFCYNPTRDSIAEIMIIAKDENLYEQLRENNLQFDLSEYSLERRLVLGYDADVYTNALDGEIAFMPLYYFNLFMISICDSPTFEWRKEMFEQEGKHKYVETEDLKFHYRNFASILLVDESSLEEKMTLKFGEFIFDDNLTLIDNLEAIRESKKYQEYKSYIDENIITDEKYAEKFLENGVNLQIAMNLEENKYVDLEQLGDDVMKIYWKNEWFYTFIMLNYLCDRLLKLN